jgi:hypothetical protein
LNLILLVRIHIATQFMKLLLPDTRYTEGNVAGKDYTKALGHYSNFGNCLKAIARNKTNDKQNYSSIIDYLETYRQIEKSINELINTGI